MARGQGKSDARKNGRQRLSGGKRAQGIEKHRPQTPLRKSPRLEAILRLEKRASLPDQTVQQHPFPSLSTSNTRSSNLSTCKKPSDPGQILSRKRKLSQGPEDLVSQPKNRRIDVEPKTFTRKNEEHHQLPSPSTSNSHKHSSEKERRRLVSIKPRSEITNNRYPKRRSSPISERPEEGPKVSESKEKEDPIRYWAASLTWPDNFAEFRAMSSNNTNKRPRRSDHSQSSKDEKSRSYSQSRKDGDAPEQYTKAYENHILNQGLDMDDFKGGKLVSSDSKMTCKDLQKMAYATISLTVFPNAETLEVIKLCRNRNEAMVNRDITPLIVPPVKALYLEDKARQDKANQDEANRFEYLTDEVNTQWAESWVLTGPRPKPDLAIGFLSSSFTTEENQKLTNYTSFENLTRPTDELCFPFLMCEVKCGNEGLDYADRQNMHSCSVAVKALLKLEQKADQYREDKQFESLLGKMLVYSISHDQKDARLYGHYALIEGEKWTYYRHHIRKFDIAHEEKDLLALHNFARNVLTEYAPELLERIQKAIAALPVSSTLSFYAGSLSLEDNWQQGSQQLSQHRDAEGFATPDLPASTQKLLDEQKEQMDKLLQQLEQQLSRQLDQQRQDSKEQTDKLLKQLEQQRKESKGQMDELKKEKDDQREQIKTLTDLLAKQIAGR